MHGAKLVILTIALASSLNATADSEKWSEAIGLCNANFNDLVDYMLTRAKAMGNPPPDSEVEAFRSQNPCKCVYEKVSEATSNLDYSNVNQDMIRIENWYGTKGLYKGHKPEDWERSLFIQTLDYGETSLQTRGIAQMECIP